MERKIEFFPAFDKRDSGPKKNYGIHGVNLRFLLKGERGATQFVVYTNWHLPHVTQEIEMDCKLGNVPRFCRLKPMAADLGYHSPKPMYEGQSLMTDNCEVLGGPCYYDGTSLGAEPVFERLLREGDAGVWAALEDEYRKSFGDLV